jgi:hypothetical protein
MYTNAIQYTSVKPLSVVGPKRRRTRRKWTPCHPPSMLKEHKGVRYRECLQGFERARSGSHIAQDDARPFPRCSTA